MFTLAIFRPQMRRLTIARDRVCVKPLYIMHRVKVLAFAFEAKAFSRPSGHLDRSRSIANGLPNI